MWRLAVNLLNMQLQTTHTGYSTFKVWGCGRVANNFLIKKPEHYEMLLHTPGIKHGQGIMLTTHTHLVPRSRTSRRYTSPPPLHLQGIVGQFHSYLLLKIAKIVPEEVSWPLGPMG
jgi:hypothetical protein